MFTHPVTSLKTRFDKFAPTAGKLHVLLVGYSDAGLVQSPVPKLSGFDLTPGYLVTAAYEKPLSLSLGFVSTKWSCQPPSTHGLGAFAPVRQPLKSRSLSLVPTQTLEINDCDALLGPRW